MKKMKRIVALFAALILVCLSATGCNAIDEMRARHAFYIDNGNGIMFGEVEYRLLPESKYLTPLHTGDDFVHVTDEDVPVLLSAILGVEFGSYNDGLILNTAVYGDHRYYCRADKYDELVAQLTGEFTPTGYCYFYSSFDTETQAYSHRGYLLTEAQEQAVNEVLETVAGVARTEYPFIPASYQVTVSACSDDMLLSEVDFTIEKHGDFYYIVDYSFYSGDKGFEYAVPISYNDVFDGIMKKQIEAQKAEEQYYSDFYDDDEDEYDIDYEMI